MCSGTGVCISYVLSCKKGSQLWMIQLFNHLLKEQWVAYKITGRAKEPGSRPAWPKSLPRSALTGKLPPLPSCGSQCYRLYPSCFRAGSLTLLQPLMPPLCVRGGDGREEGQGESYSVLFFSYHQLLCKRPISVSGEQNLPSTLRGCRLLLSNLS